MKKALKESERHVESVLRAFEILESLEQESWTSLKKISELTGINKSRILRLCGTLISLGYIQKDSNTGHYTIGYRIMPLSRAYQSHNPIITHALPILKELVQITGESISISKIVGIHRIGLAWQEGTHEVRFSVSTEGKLIPLWAGAAGKVLLAFADDEVVASVIAGKDFSTRITDTTIYESDRLYEELRLVKERSYAVSLGERISESAALAVPIYDFSGRVCAAMAVISTVHRFSDEQYLKHLPILKEKAAALSLMLGSQTH